MEISKEVLKVLKERRSVRKYQKKEIPHQIIEEIIDCARLAPTAINIQPWEFIVITEERKREEIAEMTDHGKFIKDAPVCIAVFCKDTKYYLEDGSAATTYILLAAKVFELGSCWIAGDKKFYAEKVRKYLGVPEGYKLISLISIGYPEEIPSPSKRTLREVLHWEKW